MVLLSGCTEQTSTTSETIKEQTKTKLSSIEPSDLILQVSDLPSNFTIKERAERVKSDLDEDAKNLGWKKGYSVIFIKGETIFDMTAISHSISIYPIDNISKVLDIPRKSNENRTYDELSNPNIGDKSKAFRVTENSGFETRSYMIEFVKMDVYEYISIGGTSTDYELLKELAKKAEAKIK
jgi:PBP1b-binding outer membrane lipoprotein LpoB